MGNGKQGEFDMVFWDDDGNLVIVEAKGCNSRLGSRQIKYDDSLSGKRAQQGTKEYMDDIIANYRAKLGTDHEVVKELMLLQDADQLRYMSVRQPLNPDGSLSNNYVVSEFDL